MILDKTKTVDPRGNLEKARRWELQQFAEVNKVAEITPDMPAILMREILRAKGLTHIPVPDRPLGHTNQPNPRKMYENGVLVAPPRVERPPEATRGIEANATTDLMRQYLASQKQATTPPAPAPTATPDKPKRLVERPRSEINQLRDECKRLNIKMERRDNMATLKAKIGAYQTGVRHGEIYASPSED